MKLNDFLTQISEHSLAVKNWVESDAMDEGLYVYFKDGEDLFFVFILMTGPIYLGALTNILNLPFVKDVGISPTFDSEGEVFEKAYDLVIKLDESIEDLSFNGDNQCNCEGGCEGCGEDGCDREGDEECDGGCNGGCKNKKKIWN